MLLQDFGVIAYGFVLGSVGAVSVVVMGFNTVRVQP